MIADAEKLDRLAKLQRIDFLLHFKWDCGIPGCNGAGGHRMPNGLVHPYPHARSTQIAPDGDWSVLMFCTGRGFGKTRAGAEFVKKRALGEKNHRVAIITPDFAVGRDVCIEGESGLRGLTEDQGVIPWEYIKGWNRSTGELTLHNGSQFKIFGTNARADAESIRGYQAHTAWFEELGTQRYGDVAMDMMEFALRLGKDPRMVITTTPRRIPIIKRLLEDPTVKVVRGSTLDNAANLPAMTVARLKSKYENTTLGRQELYGELLEDMPGALWSMEMIEADRVKEPPQLDRIVVAVDPAGSHRKDSDETGIVVVGQSGDHYYVLDDYSGIYTPDEWAQKVITAYHEHEADRVVAETNYGGDMVESTLRSTDRNVSYRKVTATRGKALRAEPIVALYEQHRVHHVAAIPDLEDQMTTWVPPGQFELDEKTGARIPLEHSNWSPDRVDALVWGVTELSQKQKRYMRGAA